MSELKSQISEAIANGQYSSYLAISWYLHVDAVIVQRLFRELQLEWEVEMNSWLVE